jgi:hypothetical protein
MRIADEYEGCPQVVPGVFIEAGEAVYIVDDEGEVVSWNYNEIEEDEEAFTAALTAVALAAKWGPRAVRNNIGDGSILEDLIKATALERAATMEE